MAVHTDQIDCKTKSSFRKQRKALKKMTAKKMRREGKKKMEDAPKKVIGGWLY